MGRQILAQSEVQPGKGKRRLGTSQLEDKGPEGRREAFKISDKEKLRLKIGNVFYGF